MSIDLIVIFRTERLPSAQQWQSAIQDLRYPLEVGQSINWLSHVGYLPCKFDGASTGFELYCESHPEGSSYLPATFTTRGDTVESVSATIAAGALAFLSAGELEESETGERYCEGHIVQWIAQRVANLADEQGTANECPCIDEIVDAGIRFLLRNTEMSDAEAMEKLIQFVDECYAGPLVTWIPIAFGRKLYGSVTFSESYVFVDPQTGTRSRRQLADQPIYRTALTHAQDGMPFPLNTADMNKLTLRSPEIESIHAEARKGTPLQGLQVPEPIVRIDGLYTGRTSPLTEDGTSESAGGRVKWPWWRFRQAPPEE